MSATFMPEEFKKELRAYLLKWAASWGFLMSAVAISILMFLHSQGWQFPPPVNTGTLTIGKIFAIKLFDVGPNAVGLFAMGINIFGLFAGGVNAYGLLAVGVNAIGIFAVGVNAVGVFAVGVNAVGYFAVGVNTVGFYAHGCRAYGIYALSYEKKGKGRYVFSPARQDAEAVELFTRWLPELEVAFSDTSVTQDAT